MLLISFIAKTSTFTERLINVPYPFYVVKIKQCLDVFITLEAAHAAYWLLWFSHH